ncbi:MAG: hypothetical protein MI748_03990 [Opitutales bacterium]|nr:hypothetical protein [Opitutales bacterium]
MAKHQRFVVTFFVVWLCAVVAYMLFFQKGVVRDKPVVPTSYKHMLLEEVPSPRILVESGSNALHSINGELMESLLGYPVVILADHAGASLSDKVERLKKYARAGDYVVLPLEWGFYLDPDLKELHLKISLEEVNFYYHSLPLWRQLFRALETPFPIVWSRIMGRNLFKADDYQTEMARVDFFVDHYLQFVPYGGASLMDTPKEDARGKICDHYILWQFNEGQPALNVSFRRTMKSLSKLQKKGVNLIVIPPVVVGYDCYEEYGVFFDPIFYEAQEVLDELGISYLSDYQDFVMHGDYYLNTHFHVDIEGRDLVTPIIADHLVQAGWIKPKTLTQGTPEIARELISEIRERLLSEKLSPWRGNPTEIIHGEKRSVFAFGDDWYSDEDWGRWAKSESATIIFRPEAGSKFRNIYINAVYLGASEKTKVFINDELIAEQDFAQNHLLSLPEEVQYLAGEDGLIRLTFESSQLLNPETVNGNSDTRRLKFGLHSLELKP